MFHQPPIADLVSLPTNMVLHRPPLADLISLRTNTELPLLPAASTLLRLNMAFLLTNTTLSRTDSTLLLLSTVPPLPITDLPPLRLNTVHLPNLPTTSSTTKCRMLRAVPSSVTRRRVEMRALRAHTASCCLTAVCRLSNTGLTRKVTSLRSDTRRRRTLGTVRDPTPLPGPDRDLTKGPEFNSLNVHLQPRDCK
uniref:Uncharacterized protein n=1 Tax=Timema shepardi TaxID=629360 RepID=A0A7R9FYJ4_TIMSH|nr:unnamed protein product [Timema shepardi]